MKRRGALREAYDRERDGFRCHWSGVILEERDHADPFHLCFDHLVPVKTSVLVVSSELFNSMKTELAPVEFPRVIQELAAHRAGRPFDRECIAFSHWGVRAPSPPEPGRETVTKVLSKECIVCGMPPHRWSLYCPRCHRFVRWHHRDFRARAGALREAWSSNENGFLCHYTGVKVEEINPMSPWFLTFDRRIPRNKETLVVAAWWVNAMKTALSENELGKVVGEYDRYLREGGEFDRDVVEYEYWRRARGRRRSGAGGPAEVRRRPEPARGAHQALRSCPAGRIAPGR